MTVRSTFQYIAAWPFARTDRAEKSETECLTALPDKAKCERLQETPFLTKTIGKSLGMIANREHG